MLKRFLSYIKSLLSGGLDKLENPELLLEQAQIEMREVQSRNRERAVQAVTAKNNLQQQVTDMQNRVDNLGKKAEVALKSGQRDLALQLLKEKQSYDQSLQAMKVQLEQAIEMSEQVKVAIQREEEKIRQKTAEALALKAQWKNSQIQIAMNKAFEGMQGIEDVDQSFGRARAKIKNATSEASARNEISSGRVESKIAALEASEGDIAAENELAALEAKLGLGSAPLPQTATVKPEDSSVMSELERLEAKIGGSSGS